MILSKLEQVHEECGHTEVCRVVVGGTIKAQSLQVGDEVRDRALVDTLSLTENVKLWRNKIIQGKRPFKSL